MARIAVKFRVSCSPYSQGDVAVFDEPFARRLIALRAAEELERKKETASAAKIPRGRIKRTSQGK